MNDLQTGGRDNRPSPARITVWIAVAGIGLFLLISGIVGIIAKGSTMDRRTSRFVAIAGLVVIVGIIAVAWFVR